MPKRKPSKCPRCGAKQKPKGSPLRPDQPGFSGNAATDTSWLPTPNTTLGRPDPRGRPKWLTTARLGIDPQRGGTSQLPTAYPTPSPATAMAASSTHPGR